jgi:disulfide bond formation protein DsbB
MISNIASVIPSLVLTSHIVLVVLVVSLLAHRSWGRVVTEFLGKHAVLWGFLISLGAILGSLFYSQIVGYEACDLCWWQRVFIYPQVLIFGLALWKKNKSAFFYAVPMAIVAGLVALYQVLAVDVGWGSFLACTSVGAACAKVYVKEFGYVTIPVMSLTITLYVLVVAWAKRLVEKRND